MTKTMTLEHQGDEAVPFGLFMLRGVLSSQLHNRVAAMKWATPRTDEDAADYVDFDLRVRDGEERVTEDRPFGPVLICYYGSRCFRRLPKRLISIC